MASSIVACSGNVLSASMARCFSEVSMVRFYHLCPSSAQRLRSPAGAHDTTGTGRVERLVQSSISPSPFRVLLCEPEVHRGASSGLPSPS
jgi:hypothetical protein